LNFRLTHRGDPVPCPRPRVTQRGTYMPKRYRDYKDQLVDALAEKLSDNPIQHYDELALYGLKAIFFRRGQRKADIDNLLKTVSDAATGIFWANDREQYGRVIYGSTDPRVEIEIYLLTGG
jgi:Holliday junction resolvase RusA-like endonuclease